MRKQAKRRMSFTICFATLLVVLAVVSLFGCASDDDSNPWRDGDSDTADGDGDTPDGDAPDGDAPDGDTPDGDSGPIEADTLNGVWGIKFSIAYTCLLPVFEKRVQFILTGIGRLVVDQNETDIGFTEEVCDFSLKVVEEEEVPFIVIFPQEEIQAVPIEDRFAALDALEIGTRFKTQPTTDIYGADASQFDDPATDELPTSPEDPRVVNFGDDKPGITARLGGPFIDKSVYVVMRMLRDMEGTLTNSSLIEGFIESNVEMVTIGASNPIVFLQLDLEPHDVADLNRFEMVRLDDSYTCSEIYADEAALFSYDPFDYAVPFTYDK